MLMEDFILGKNVHSFCESSYYIHLISRNSPKITNQVSSHCTYETNRWSGYIITNLLKQYSEQITLHEVYFAWFTKIRDNVFLRKNSMDLINAL